MNSSLIPLLGVGVLTGVIPASIAGRKGYNFLLWWVFGTALLIVALPIAFFIKYKDPSLVLPKKEERMGHKIVDGITASIIYFIAGLCFAFVGEIPFLVSSSNNPEGARGADLLSFLLCFVSGLAFCSYFRWYEKNASAIKLHKIEKQKYVADLSNNNDTQ
jgi:hypothetical protein